MSAKALVPDGASDQVSGGEMSFPSQVYFFGIFAPFEKAVELMASDMAASPPWSAANERAAPRAAARIGFMPLMIPHAADGCKQGVVISAAMVARALTIAGSDSSG